MKGLFINSQKAQCSIYEAGKLAYDALKLSEKYTLDYLELNNSYFDYTEYNFIFINYHFTVLKHLNIEFVKKLPIPTFAYVLEMLPDNPFAHCQPEWFNYYIVPDPTMQESKNVFSFPRPIPLINDKLEKKEINLDDPIIGGLGFASTIGHNWSLLFSVISSEFEKFTINLHMPHATYADSSLEVYNSITSQFMQINKEGRYLNIITEYMDQYPLIKLLNSYDIMCYFYYRPGISGLASGPDYAISAETRIAVTEDPTFRHIHKYIDPYPDLLIKENINSKKTYEKIIQMKKDWSPAMFCKKFEKILEFIL